VTIAAEATEQSQDPASDSTCMLHLNQHALKPKLLSNPHNRGPLMLPQQSRLLDNARPLCEPSLSEIEIQNYWIAKPLMRL
jgi:hypothetical protein